jgi:hypothetical protein
LPLGGVSLFHSELAAEARQLEKRKRLVQLVKKIGISLKRRLLPLEGNPLFHSELAAEARQLHREVEPFGFLCIKITYSYRDNAQPKSKIANMLNI